MRVLAALVLCGGLMMGQGPGMGGGGGMGGWMARGPMDPAAQLAAAEAKAFADVLAVLDEKQRRGGR